jgi:hypothetical protein
MLSPNTDWSQVADDDPRAPWIVDPLYGGMTPGSARKSWETAQEREPEPEPLPPFDDAPPPQGEADYGLVAAVEPEPAPPFKLPPLTLDEWLNRDDLAPPDFIMGDWLTTTSRCLLYAPTGIGKSLKVMALAMHAAAGRDFLHWRGRRTCKVLYVDGEMSRRLLRERIVAEAARLGETPATFYALSHEDVEQFAPLNSLAGQAYIDRLIAELGSVDLIIFDAIMCLLAGDPKENEPWSQVMPWVRSLTKRKIGQIWVHHTGHDATKGYGDKTREWQLDTVIALEPAENPETDVSFTLSFRKARERAPSTRADFADTTIALMGNEWHTNRLASRKSHVSPLGLKFHQALLSVLASDAAGPIGGRRTATLAAWKQEAARLGLTDPASNAKSADSLFNKHRRELIAANYIACDDQAAWTV